MVNIETHQIIDMIDSRDTQDVIISILHRGMPFKKIEESIRKKGYDGVSSTIRMFTTRERKLVKEAKNGQNTPVEKIERKSDFLQFYFEKFFMFMVKISQFTIHQFTLLPYNTINNITGGIIWQQLCLMQDTEDMTMALHLMEEEKRMIH